MPFWQISDRAGIAVPCKCSPQKCIIAFEKLFLFLVLMNIWNDWKAKLESAHSFMLKYSKITVWYLKPTHNCCDHAVPETSSVLPSTSLKVSLEISSPCFSATVPLPKYVLIDPAMFVFQTLFYSFDHPVTKKQISSEKFCCYYNSKRGKGSLKVS